MIPCNPRRTTFRAWQCVAAAGFMAVSSTGFAQTIGGARPSSTPAQTTPSGPAAAAPAGAPAAVKFAAAKEPAVVEPAENPLAARSAESNVVFGQIVSVQDKRLNIRDGETLTGLNLTPRTVITINGETGTVAALQKLDTSTRVQVIRDPKTPSRILRIVAGEGPAVGAGGAGTATLATGDNSAATQPAAKAGVSAPEAAARAQANAPNRTPPANQSAGSAVGTSRGVAPTRPNARVAPRQQPGRTNQNPPSVNKNNPPPAGTGVHADPSPGANRTRDPNSIRPFAPGQIPDDQPLSPGARGPEQPLAPGTRDSRPLAPGTSGTTGTTNLGSLTTNGAVPFVDLGFGLIVGADGVSVGTVIPTGVAGTAGFLTGDVIVSLQGQAVASPAEFQQALAGFHPGDHLVAEVMRNGSAERVTLTLPEDFDPKAPRPLTHTTPSLANVDTRMFAPVELGWDLKDTKEGPLVLVVHAKGPAHDGQLEAGDIITTIDDHAVSTPGAVFYELNRHPAKTAVNIGLLRDGERMSKKVVLPESHHPQLLESDAATSQQATEIQALREEIRQLRQEIQEFRSSRK